MIYLDNAAGTFPKPAIMGDALLDAVSVLGANPGRGSYALSRHTAAMVDRVRSQMAALFHVKDPTRMVFTSGATMSLNMAIFGLDLKGKHVILTDLEHNAVLRPLYALEERGDITLTVVEADGGGHVRAADLAAAVRDNTGLMVLTHASNVLGTVQPVEEAAELSRITGIPLLVDASQSAGYVDLDGEKTGIAMIAFPAHKGLYGPAGIGGLYVKEGIQLKPLLYGGTGMESERRSMPDLLPMGLEAGSLPVPLIAGFGAALSVIAEEGTDAMREHGLMLIRYFLRKTAHLPVRFFWNEDGREKVPVLSFVVEGQEPWETAEKLDRLGIAVRSGFHCAPLIHRALGTAREGTVRLSPSRFTTHEDMDLAALALEKVIAPWRP